MYYYISPVLISPSDQRAKKGKKNGGEIFPVYSISQFLAISAQNLTFPQKNL